MGKEDGLKKDSTPHSQEETDRRRDEAFDKAQRKAGEQNSADQAAAAGISNLFGHRGEAEDVREFTATRKESDAHLISRGEDFNEIEYARGLMEREKDIEQYSDKLLDSLTRDAFEYRGPGSLVNKSWAQEVISAVSKINNEMKWHGKIDKNNAFGESELLVDLKRLAKDERAGTYGVKLIPAEKRMSSYIGANSPAVEHLVKKFENYRHYLSSNKGDMEGGVQNAAASRLQKDAKLVRGGAGFDAHTGEVTSVSEGQRKELAKDRELQQSIIWQIESLVDSLKKDMDREEDSNFFRKSNKEDGQEQPGERVLKLLSKIKTQIDSDIPVTRDTQDELSMVGVRVFNDSPGEGLGIVWKDQFQMLASKVEDYSDRIKDRKAIKTKEY